MMQRSPKILSQAKPSRSIIAADATVKVSFQVEVVASSPKQMSLVEHSLHPPVSLPVPSLGLPSQLRNQILSYIPIWQLQRWDHQERRRNCRHDLPPSAQRYSELLSRDNLLQQLQLRYQLSRDQLKEWYDWTFKSMVQLQPVMVNVDSETKQLLAVPLLTPMQAYSRISYYFNEAGEDIFMRINCKDRQLQLLILQLQAPNGTMEFELLRLWLKQSKGWDVTICLHFYHAMKQPLEVLQVIVQHCCYAVPGDSLLRMYSPSPEQIRVLMAVKPSSELSSYNNGLQSNYSGMIPLAYNYWLGVLRRHCNVGQLDLASDIGQRFVKENMLQLQAEEIAALKLDLGDLYHKSLVSLNYFSLVQLDYNFGMPAELAQRTDLPIIISYVISKQQIATVPLLRQWVLDHLPDIPWRRGYLLILDVLAGVEIALPESAADLGFEQQDDDMAEATSDFETVLLDLILAVASPNLDSYSYDQGGDYYSEVIYDPNKLIHSGTSDYPFQLWSAGRQLEINELIPSGLRQYERWDDEYPLDVAGQVFGLRDAASDPVQTEVTLYTLNLEDLPFWQSVLPENLLRQKLRPNFSDKNALRKWLQLYPIPTIKILLKEGARGTLMTETDPVKKIIQLLEQIRFDVNNEVDVQLQKQIISYLDVAE